MDEFSKLTTVITALSSGSRRADYAKELLFDALCRQSGLDLTFAELAAKRKSGRRENYEQRLRKDYNLTQQEAGKLLSDAFSQHREQQSKLIRTSQG